MLDGAGSMHSSCVCDGAGVGRDSAGAEAGSDAAATELLGCPASASAAAERC